jgi:hypothetical protein
VRASPIIDPNHQAMPGRRTFQPYIVALLATFAAQEYPNAAQHDRLDELHRREGEAIIAIADAALAGRGVPADFTIHWKNDLLKAQQGTFVPFVVTIDPLSPAPSALLLYVRLVARPGPTSRHEESGDSSAVEAVYPVALRATSRGPIRLSRGFAARPGEYDLVVVVRERIDYARPSAPRRAAALTQRLTVPDFAHSDLTTSSVILADGMTVPTVPPATEQSEDRPYLIGLSEIQPSADAVFRRSEELIVVFLVYNPAVTPERKFDIEVEYHFFTKAGGPGGDREVPADLGRPPAREGERYFNHTKPQRFTPAIMGPQFDPTAGQPLMAGQGVPLASFPEGEYRLSIKVTDVVTGKTIVRDVIFSVVS